MTLALTYDLDLQSPQSYCGAEVQGQRSDGSEYRVETNGQTDGGDRITSLANAVGIKSQAGGCVVVP